MATELEMLDVDGLGNTSSPNSVVFNLSNIFSRTISGVTYQIAGFYNSASKLCIAIRTYPFGRFRIYRFDGVDKTDLGSITADGHQNIALAIDADGLIHIAWGVHNGSLLYRRSDAAIGSWTGGVTAAQSMLGTNEASVSYPVFFISPTGKLYFTFRDGISGNGDQYFYVWDDAGDTWSSGVGAAGKLINGKTSTASAYLNGAPKFSPDWDGAGTGYMHWSWCWRDSSSSTDNHDILHAKFDGTNWKQMDGTSQTTPITEANAGVASTIAVGAGNSLLNSIDFDLTSRGYPVVGVVKNDGSSKSQLWALYWNGSAWSSLQQITSFGTSGQTDWGRPIVVINRNTNICYMIGGHFTASATAVTQWASNPQDFTTWTSSTFYSRTNFGGTEFGYDRRVWKEEGYVSCVMTQSEHVANTTNVPVFVLSRHPKDQAQGTFPNTWARKHTITIDHTKVGSGGVSDFSVLLSRANFANEVCDPSSVYAARSDGGDLRFTSDSAGTTALPCHVVSFGLDSSTNAADATVEIYVKVSSISSASDTVIYCWYHAYAWQPFVSETNGQQNAYDSNTKISLPFSHTMDNAANDSFHSVDRSSTLQAYTSGKVGEGFSGTTNRGFLYDPASAITISTAYSLAAWVSVGASLANICQIISNDKSDATTDRVFQFRIETSGLVTFIRFDSGQSAVANFSGATDLRNAGFKRVWATFDTTNGSKIYVDGSSDGTNGTLTANRNVASTSHLSVGYRESGTDDGFFLGTLDNVQLHTASRNAAWITTDFNNQNSPSTFSSPGSATSTLSTPNVQSFVVF